MCVIFLLASWPPRFSPLFIPCILPSPPQHPFAGGIVDFDWSNAKEIWAKNKPMNDEELLFEQVKITTAATPGATVWVYRCSVYGSFIREVCDFLIYFLTPHKCTPHPTTRPAYPWYTRGGSGRWLHTLFFFFILPGALGYSNLQHSRTSLSLHRADASSRLVAGQSPGFHPGFIQCVAPNRLH